MGTDIMSYLLLILILFLVSVAMMIPYGLYLELGDRKRECERLRKELAARESDLWVRDEIERRLSKI